MYFVTNGGEIMFEEIVSQVFLGNRLLDYGMAILFFLAGMMCIKVIQNIFLKYLKVWAEKTATTADDFILDVLKKGVLPLGYFGLFYVSVNMLRLIASVKNILNIAATAVLTLLAVRVVIMAINYGFKIFLKRRGQDMAAQRSLKGILDIIRVAVWGLAIIFFLDNLGFKISAVIAGLGIGGVAVALAAQAVLGDLFSYVAILFDRPFEIGDFIIIDNYMGTVEHIGVKTTRISSLGGEQLVFSNTDLTNSRVRNYKKMKKRRVVFKLGVVYQTPVEQLKEIPGMIAEIIKKREDTTFDRAHFLAHGDFSLNFEIVYYVKSGDYNQYMDIQQAINFAISEAFASRKIDFAYPTQTVFVNKEAL